MALTISVFLLLQTNELKLKIKLYGMQVSVYYAFLYNLKSDCTVIIFASSRLPVPPSSGEIRLLRYFFIEQEFLL